MATILRLCLALSGAGIAWAQPPDAESLYRRHCAPCHEASAATRAPARDVLRQASPEFILQALEQGTMKPQGAALSPDDRRALAVLLAGKALGAAAGSSAGACPEGKGEFRDPFAGPYWNGWGVDLSNSRLQTAAMAGLDASSVPRLRLKWAFGFAGAISAYAQPTIAGGRVYVGSSIRTVYSLDASSGCVHWSITTSAPVRSAITLATLPRTRRCAAYFGDLRAYVYAVDAATGDLLWKTNVEDFPNARITGAVKVHEGRVYVPVSITEDGPATDSKYECCRSRPSVVALDAATGRQLWKTLTIQETPHKTIRNAIGTQQWGPSGAPVWCSPTIDPRRKVLYVGTGDNHSAPATKTSDAVLALDLDSGRIVWSRQLTVGDTFNVSCVRPDKTNCPDPAGPDHDIGASPVLVSLAAGKRALIVGAKSGVVTALDPDHQGATLWQVRIGKGGTLGGVQWGLAADAQNAYIALSDVSIVSREPRHYVPDPKSGGGLFALRLGSGERAWTAKPPECGERKQCSPAQSAAVSAIPGVVFSGGVDGRMRAYSMKDGAVIWEFDAVREFETVNHVPARGGSFDGPGPVIASGMLFTNAGYGSWGGTPGNVLLAFSVE